MPIKELLNPFGADCCTQSVTDLDLVESISYESDNENEPDEATDDEPESLPGCNEQLSFVLTEDCKMYWN